MTILINWLLSSLVIIVGAYILPGVHVESFLTALVLAIVLGIINALLKPILILLTLPINILSLGLFTLVINAALIMLATVIVPGFKVDSFWWALLYGIVLSFLNWFVFQIVKK
jgi:putative membrane protein